MFQDFFRVVLRTQSLFLIFVEQFELGLTAPRAGVAPGGARGKKVEVTASKSPGRYEHEEADQERESGDAVCVRLQRW